MTSDRKIADAARAYVWARLALQNDSVPSTMTSTVIVEDLAWYLLVQLCTAEHDDLTEPADTRPL